MAHMAELQHQEAMDVDEESQCTPEKVFHALTTNNLACNLRVLGSQLGLKTSDLETISQNSRSYEDQLIKTLCKCRDLEYLSWINIVSVLRKPALKQYRIAAKLRNTIRVTNVSSESDSVTSPQSARSSSLESSMTFPMSFEESGTPGVSECSSTQLANTFG